MICPECLGRMVVVDNGDGDPVWICRCGTALAYNPSEDGADDGRLEEMKIRAMESDR